MNMICRSWSPARSYLRNPVADNGRPRGLNMTEYCEVAMNKTRVHIADRRALLVALCAALLFVGCGEPSNSHVYMNGTVEQVRERLQTESDINAPDERGWTPLMLAASRNPNVDVIKFLISSGADVQAQSRTAKAPPLTLAATWNSNPEIVKALISAGKTYGTYIS